MLASGVRPVSLIGRRTAGAVVADCSGPHEMGVVMRRQGGKYWSRLVGCVVGAAVVALAAGSCGAGEAPDAGASATAGGTGMPFAGKTLRVAMWGGDWNAKREAIVGKRFKEETGATIEYVFGVDGDHVSKLLAARGQTPPFDAVEATMMGFNRMSQLGLLEAISVADVPNLNQVDKAVVFPDRVAFDVVEVGIAYSPKKYQELGLPIPTSWNDLYAPRLAGKVSVGVLGQGFVQNMLVALAEQNGGGIDNIEPGMKKLAQLKVESYFQSTADLTTKLTQGEVWAAGPWHSSIIARLQDQGLDIAFAPVPTHGKTTYGADTFVGIAKGTEQKQLAAKYLDISLDPKVQLEWTRAVFSKPTNIQTKALIESDPELSKTIKERPYIVRDESDIYRIDYATASSKLDQWQDLWNRTIR
jgi:putative spermidine/putrescine transport system substrate-binding protein